MGSREVELVAGAGGGGAVYTGNMEMRWVLQRPVINCLQVRMKDGQMMSSALLWLSKRK